MKIKIKLSSFVLFILISIYQPYARASQVDAPNLAVNILDTINKKIEGMEKKALLNLEFENIAKRFGLLIDENDKAKASAIGRINKTAQDIYNLDIVGKFQSSPSACQTNRVAIELNDVVNTAWCEYSENTDKNNKISIASIPFDKDTPITTSYDPKKEYKSYTSPEVKSSYRHMKNKDLTDTIKEQLPELFNEKEDYPSEEELAKSPLSSRQVIGKKYLTLNEKDFQSALDYVELIAPPYEAPRSKTFSNLLTLNKMSNSVRQGVPRAILTKLASNRKSGVSGESKLSTIMNFGKSKFSPGDVSGSFIKEITTSKLSHPYSILREVAVLNMFANYMALERYENSLNKELLIATRLSKKLNNQ